MSSLTTLFLDPQYGWHGPVWWWPIFPLLWFAFIAIVVWRVGFVGRRHWREHGTRSGEARLAERYASGEIDEQEYERRLATLRRLGQG
ncbi:MAG: SHOCT domain-containing protein [Angustibacter sp.]